MGAHLLSELLSESICELLPAHLLGSREHGLPPIASAGTGYMAQPRGEPGSWGANGHPIEEIGELARLRRSIGHSTPRGGQKQTQVAGGEGLARATLHHHCPSPRAH